jgi:uncharacterized protein (TIGR02996 family)
MSDEQAFLEHLASDPYDDVTRSVYADWLDEQGDSRGEYLRLEMELAGLGDDDPRQAEMEARCRSLRAGLSSEWLDLAGKRFAVWLVSYPAGFKIAAIKVIRELTGIGLKEAKDLSEALPARVVGNRVRPAAEAIRDRFEQLRDTWTGQPGNSRAIISPDQAGPAVDSPRPGTFTVVLASFHPSQRIEVILGIREALGVSLAEAKQMSERPLPLVLRQGIGREEAERIRSRFPDSVGLSVEQV